jgi:predicted O-linked N-acetylglucosamine transferase (SPINDLY family)
MGVPTLTLCGQTMISRQGETMMRAAGLPEWVAVDREDYVRKAVQWAGDLPALARLRESMRGRVQGTAMFDVHLFAQRLEQALAAIWQKHVIDADRGNSNALTQNVGPATTEGVAE